MQYFINTSIKSTVSSLILIISVRRASAHSLVLGAITPPPPLKLSTYVHYHKSVYIIIDSKVYTFLTKEIYLSCSFDQSC
jgi:hypothetical protein